MRQVRTVFESLAPTHSRAAPKSLCCSYCLCCREYFIRIFQYLFFYFCPCKCLTRPLISYILMHRAPPQASLFPTPHPTPTSPGIINKSLYLLHLCQESAAFSIPRSHGNERIDDLLNKMGQVGPARAEASRWLTLASVSGELASSSPTYM